MSIKVSVQPDGCPFQFKRGTISITSLSDPVRAVRRLPHAARHLDNVEVRANPTLIHTLRCIFLSKRLCETWACVQSEPGGGFKHPLGDKYASLSRILKNRMINAPWGPKLTGPSNLLIWENNQSKNVPRSVQLNIFSFNRYTEIYNERVVTYKMEKRRTELLLTALLPKSMIHQGRRQFNHSY